MSEWSLKQEIDELLATKPQPVPRNLPTHVHAHTPPPRTSHPAVPRASSHSAQPADFSGRSPYGNGSGGWGDVLGPTEFRPTVPVGDEGEARPIGPPLSTPPGTEPMAAAPAPAPTRRATVRPLENAAAPGQHEEALKIQRGLLEGVTRVAVALESIQAMLYAMSMQQSPISSGQEVPPPPEVQVASEDQDHAPGS